MLKRLLCHSDKSGGADTFQVAANVVGHTRTSTNYNKTGHEQFWKRFTLLSAVVETGKLTSHSHSLTNRAVS